MMNTSSRKLRLGCVRFFMVVLVVLNFCLPTDSVSYYSGKQVMALQNLRSSWSRTPNQQENLKGWRAENRYPCFADDDNDWRGVDCLQISSYSLNQSGSVTAFDIRVVGITLNDVNITGLLPPAIGSLAPLVSLVLTGNRKLKGRIPSEIANLNESLFRLDLHGNALSGDLFHTISGLQKLQHLDLSNNKFTGRLPSLTPLTRLRTLSLADNDLEDDISFSFKEEFQNLSYLTTLNLSNNSLSGAIQVLELAGRNPTLKYMDLSKNKFTEENILPQSYSGDLGNIRRLDLSDNALGGNASNVISLIKGLGSELRVLHLDNNHINGTLYMDDILWANITHREALITLRYNNISEVRYTDQFFSDYLASENLRIRLAGNPFCNDTKQAQAAQCFCHRTCGFPEKNTKMLEITLSTSLSTAFVVILVAAYLYRRSKREHKLLLRQAHQKFEEHDVKPTIFTYNELRSATRDFHPDMKLGEGAYGAVFKGVLPNKSVVAVKQLHVNSQQGMDGFLNEVVLISGMKHRNLVKLMGCCIREKQRLLVYEYVENHDLQWVLLDGKGDQTLSWAKRMSICLGIAHGLHYLHALAQPKIIHRDIKPANILLDSNLEPKISDFGLALLFPEETTHVMTLHVAGTRGYLAPEYATVGQLSEKADVFSFGVVCLELVSGKKCLDRTAPPEQAVLTSWAQELHSRGRVMDLVDPRMEMHSGDISEVQRVVATALLCLQFRQDLRPTMARVVTLLQEDWSSSDSTLDSLSLDLDADSSAFDASSSLEMSLLGTRSVLTDRPGRNLDRPRARSDGSVSSSFSTLSRSRSIQIKLA